jgi:hypothetical protein
MQKTSVMLMSAFPRHLSFFSSSLDPQGECEGDNDDSKDNKGDKGSKHSKECKASEDNERRKGRIDEKGQVDALMIFWAVRVGRVGGRGWKVLRGMHFVRDRLTNNLPAEKNVYPGIIVAVIEMFTTTDRRHCNKLKLRNRRNRPDEKLDLAF